MESPSQLGLVRDHSTNNSTWAVARRSCFFASELLHTRFAGSRPLGASGVTRLNSDNSGFATTLSAFCNTSLSHSHSRGFQGNLGGLTRVNTASWNFEPQTISVNSMHFLIFLLWKAYSFQKPTLALEKCSGTGVGTSQ